jgi:hypothetical protein
MEKEKRAIKQNQKKNNSSNSLIVNKEKNSYFYIDYLNKIL